MYGRCELLEPPPRRPAPPARGFRSNESSAGRQRLPPRTPILAPAEVATRSTAQVFFQNSSPYCGRIILYASRESSRRLSHIEMRATSQNHAAENGPKRSRTGSSQRLPGCECADLLPRSGSRATKRRCTAFRKPRSMQQFQVDTRTSTFFVALEDDRYIISDVDDV